MVTLTGSNGTTVTFDTLVGEFVVWLAGGDAVGVCALTEVATIRNVPRIYAIAFLEMKTIIDSSYVPLRYRYIVVDMTFTVCLFVVACLSRDKRVSRKSLHLGHQK